MRARVVELVALAGLVVAQVLLFGRLVGTDTDYDEGVYLTSVDALEHGQRLGEDVFAPQPPGWYLLLRLISVAGADSVRGFHIGMVVVAIATCFAAYLLGRAIGGPVAGLVRLGAPDGRAAVPALRAPRARRRPAARHGARSPSGSRSRRGGAASATLALLGGARGRARARAEADRGARRARRS